MSKEIIPTQYIADTLKLKYTIEGHFIMLGERLHTIKKEEMWRGGYNSFSEFLGHMEMSDSQASKLVQIYARFILEYGFKHGEIAKMGIRKLYAILPLCDGKQSAKRAFEQIEGLSGPDVEKMAKQQQVGEHKHQDEKFAVCSVCRRMKRIYDDV